MFQTYQSFNNKTIRTSLRSPDGVWHALEPALKEQINAIRTRVREEREAKNATPGSDNTSSDSKILPVPMRAHLVERGDATKQVAAMVYVWSFR
jgi:hypothetical protein